MSINLCASKYGTTIALGRNISYVSQDSSSHPSSRIDHSIEPNSSKDIEFRFKVPIDLRAITFHYMIDGHCRLLSGRTCGIKLFTWAASAPMVGPMMERRPANSPSTEPNRILRCLNLPKPTITIINMGFKTSEKMRSLGFHIDPCYPLSGAKKYGILPEHLSGCQNIERLRITLSHLPERSRVVFDRFYILGQPSAQAFTVPAFKIITERLLSHKPETPRTPNKNRSLFRRGQRMVEEARQQEPANIPPAFLDPFTNQLMECPMILPCGKICDKIYLHKYIRVEKKWCRKPSDPFTGKLFTREETPRPDSQLKKLIDKWTLLTMFGNLPDWYRD